MEWCWIYGEGPVRLRTTNPLSLGLKSARGALWRWRLCGSWESGLFWASFIGLVHVSSLLYQCRKACQIHAKQRNENHELHGCMHRVLDG